MGIMGWDLDTAVAKLHRFWWWCVDYAETGDLRKYNDAMIGGAVGLNGDMARSFVEAMVESRWIDREPYFRVHNWWKYIGKFLQIKYKHQSEKWQEVRKLYAECSENGSSNGFTTPHHTDHTTQTKPAKSVEVVENAYEKFPRFVLWWKSYPPGRKDEKPKCLSEWKRLKLEAMADRVMHVLEIAKKSNKWTKSGGQFIEAPLRWLHKSPWESTDADLAEQELPPDPDAFVPDHPTVEEAHKLLGIVGSNGEGVK